MTREIADMWADILGGHTGLVNLDQWHVAPDKREWKVVIVRGTDCYTAAECFVAALQMYGGGE